MNGQHPQLAWNTFTKNVDALMAPNQPFGPFIVAQYGPEIFWSSVPLDQLETWITSHVPAEMAPNIARGMETAHFKVATRTLLVKEADEFMASHQAAR